MTPRFEISFINRAAVKEYQALDGSVRAMVNKGLARLAVRADEIGNPLGGALAGCRELKFRADGIRIVYRIVGERLEIVEIVAIGARDKGRAFEDAKRRVDDQPTDGPR